MGVVCSANTRRAVALLRHHHPGGTTPQQFQLAAACLQLCITVHTSIQWQLIAGSWLLARSGVRQTTPTPPTTRLPLLLLLLVAGAMKLAMHEEGPANPIIQ